MKRYCASVVHWNAFVVRKTFRLRTNGRNVPPLRATKHRQTEVAAAHSMLERGDDVRKLTTVQVTTVTNCCRLAKRLQTVLNCEWIRQSLRE